MHSLVLVGVLGCQVHCSERGVVAKIHFMPAFLFLVSHSLVIIIVVTICCELDLLTLVLVRLWFCLAYAWTTCFLLQLDLVQVYVQDLPYTPHTHTYTQIHTNTHIHIHWRPSRLNGCQRYQPPAGSDRLSAVAFCISALGQVSSVLQNGHGLDCQQEHLASYQWSTTEDLCWWEEQLQVKNTFHSLMSDGVQKS